jgi:hypothetical protein
MQLVTLGQPLDGCHLPALGFERKNQAGIDRLAVEQHRTGAALALTTAFFRTRQMQLFAQQL